MGGIHVAVVGAGPAGTRAAEVLHRAGCKVTVIFEGPASGGQIYRRQPQGFARPARSLYGSEASKATRLHEAFDRMAGALDVRANTTVFNVVDSRLYVHHPGGMDTISFDKLVLATGAMDRILPMPGWTLPGVYTLGGAQIALKHQACAIGRKVAFVGTGPLLYLVAFQYAKAGAHVVGVFDTAPAAGKRRALLPLVCSNFRLLARGAGFRWYLRRKGVPIREGIVPRSISGEGHVTAFKYSHGRRGDVEVECDAVGLGYGLKPETQLAELLGIPHRFDPLQRVRTVVHDGAGRAAPHIYVAGDGVAIAGADAAELSGELAAWSLLADCGQSVPHGRIVGLQKRLAHHARLRSGLDAAFPVPVQQLRDLPDATLLCRCEAVTIGTVRAAVARFDTSDVNRLKALARTGMGRCQGRVCGLATSELLALYSSRTVEQVGFVRGQAPVKPLPFEIAALGAEPAVAESVRTGLPPESAV